MTTAAQTLEFFEEKADGLLEYKGPVDDVGIVVEKWRQMDATIDIGIWGQASIAAAIEPKYRDGRMEKFAEAVEKHPSYIRRIAKTYKFYVVENKTRVSNLSFKHHSVAMRHPKPFEALEKAAMGGWGCVKLEEWILNEAVANSKVKRAAKQRRQNDFRDFLERVDGLILNDFMQTCPNAEWGRRVFENWREDITWELSQIERTEVDDRVVDAVTDGAVTVQDIKSKTGLATKDIERAVATKMTEGVWEWVREGGKTDVARGTRRAIIHVVGERVFT